MQQAMPTGSNDGRTATSAAASDFWLSPTYKKSVIQIHVFWFSKNVGDAAIEGGFYEQFWEILKPFGFHLHWGKYLPEYPMRSGHNFSSRNCPGSRISRIYMPRWL